MVNSSIQRKSQTFICSLCHVGYINEDAIRTHIRQKHLPFEMDSDDDEEDPLDTLEVRSKKAVLKNV